MDHMLVVYHPKEDSRGENGLVVRPAMPPGSPYIGFTAACLEAVSLKIGHVLMMSGL